MPRNTRRASISVRADGTVVFIYDDDLLPLMDMGRPEIRRASCVEPAPHGWTADLLPVGGPVLGPFRWRRDALAAEVVWLEEYHLQGKKAR